MPVLRPLYQDPFAPVLYESKELEVVEEQQNYIKEILRTACSDSRFAQKAYASILLVLTAGPTPLPEITSISPNTAKVGDASFTLTVTGSNFDAGAAIIWNGTVMTTQFVSDTSLTTNVDMAPLISAGIISVSVQNSNATISNSMAFDLQPTDPIALSNSSEARKARIKEIEEPKRRILARDETSKQSLVGEFPTKSTLPSGTDTDFKASSGKPSGSASAISRTDEMNHQEAMKSSLKDK